jgi:tRNA A-37 threonylcarbamoyl transferase component Bud32
VRAQPASEIDDAITHTAMRGRQLLAIRVVWSAVLLLALGMFLISLPVSFRMALTAPSAVQMGGGRLGFSGLFIATFRAVLDSVTVLVFAGIALLMVVRRSNSWLILFFSVTLILAGVNYTDGFYALYKMGWPPSGITVLLGTISALAEICQLAAFYIFPNGRFVPNWLKWLLFVWIPYRLVAWVAGYPQGLSDTVRLIDLLTQLSFFGVGIAAQAYRYRQAEALVHRQQTKWIIFGMSVAVLALVLYVGLGIVVPVLRVPDTARLIYVVAGTLLTHAALLVIPISAAISILRYRLWAIDVIINRSLVYGSLAVLVIVIFVGCAFLLGRIFTSLSGGQSALIAIAISGAALGILFQPVHRQLQVFVDRRFYGIFVDYQRASHANQPILLLTHYAGTTIGGYELLEPLGSGGMSVVYKARQSSLDRLVAIKMLPEVLASHPNFQLRFEREARVVASLRHPHIVQLFSFGESGGMYYMVMEYLEGQNLGARVHKTGPRPVLETQRIVGQIAEALDYAHQQGIIHRDVKPSNVMLVPVSATSGSHERAVLMDFGIARIVGGVTRLTNTGLVGTFDYIAPEQIRDADDIDGRVDIYSLGVLAFQMVTGRLPFTASNPGALLIAHLQQPAPDPRSLCSDLPNDIAQIILKALEKDPAKRFATAGEMVEALRKIRPDTE